MLRRTSIRVQCRVRGEFRPVDVARRRGWASGINRAPESSMSPNDAADVSTVVAADACFVAPDGLVGRWRGDGNAHDDVSGREGTLIGGTTFATGRNRDAFNFDGVEVPFGQPPPPPIITLF